MKPFASFCRSLFFAVAIVACFANRSGASEHVIFRRIASNVNDDSLWLTRHDEARLERFLNRVYPMTSMKHALHSTSAPLLRKATYDVVKLHGVRYVIVAYVSEWKQPEAFVHELAIYRLGTDGPTQVWRSAGWVANYYGLTFETVSAGSRILMLFREGGLDPSGFSLSGILSFRDSKHGLLIRDLTPRLPYLKAVANFPSRALYGKKVVLHQEEDHEVVLSASDEEFVSSDVPPSPAANWRYNPKRGRFEWIKPEHATPGGTTVSLRSPLFK